MRRLLVVFLGVIVCLTFAACSSGGISETEFQSVADALTDAEAKLAEQQSNYDAKNKEVESLSAELEAVKKEYSAYKEKMSEYEDLEKAEAEARRIEAESLAAQAEEEARLAAEEEARQKEEKEKAGYDTGITYDQLARTPDEYEGEKVKFYGRVIQVMEGDSETQIRLAVDDNYDTVLLAGYDPAIVSSRVLEEDYITIFGTSIGLITYDSTLGGKITIPGVYVDKIE